MQLVKVIMKGENLYIHVFTLSKRFSFVKLHSDLRVLTQLQLYGVGVDFVFAWKKEEVTHTWLLTEGMVLHI